MEKEPPNKKEDLPKQPDVVQTTYWAALVRENGCLEVGCRCGYEVIIEKHEQLNVLGSNQKKKKKKKFLFREPLFSFERRLCGQVVAGVVSTYHHSVVRGVGCQSCCRTNGASVYFISPKMVGLFLLGDGRYGANGNPGSRRQPHLIRLEQGWANYGPWAACGPREHSVRPANTF